MFSKIKENALSSVTIAIMAIASVVYLMAGVAVTSGHDWHNRAGGVATPTVSPTPCTPDDPKKPCPTPTPAGTPTPSRTMER